jgi:hypothetical protein
MLLRIYEPILWRALKVANPTVRMQAATLLFDAFPLTSDDAPRSEIDATMQRQFEVCTQLLMDSCPKVRVVAVTGVGHIIGSFCELMPQNVCRDLLVRLIGELSHDAAAVSVRVAVFDALRVVLKNHQCHSMLKSLLPSLRQLINDRSERVRLAFIKLLQDVKRVRTIHFSHVVPLELLFSRLVADAGTPRVAKAIADLLLNSYFPENAKGSEILSRCIAFFRRAPGAAITFYRHVHHFVDVELQAKMIILIHRCLRSCIKKGPTKPKRTASTATKKGGRKGKRTQEDITEDENGAAAATDGDEGAGSNSEATSVVSMDDLPLMASLLQCMAALWDGALVKLATTSAAPVREALEDEFMGNALPSLMVQFGHYEPAKIGIMKIAANMPQDSQQILADEALKELTQMALQLTPGAQAAEQQLVQMVSLVDALCRWGHVDTVLGKINASLRSLTSDTAVEAVTKKSKGKKGKPEKRKRGATGADDYIQPTLALRALERMLFSEEHREHILSEQNGVAPVEELLETLKSLQPLVEKRLCSQMSAVAQEDEEQRLPDDLLCLGLQLYCQLLVHQSEWKCATAAEGDTGSAMEDVEPTLSSALIDMLKWANAHSLPLLTTGMPTPHAPVAPVAAVATANTSVIGSPAVPARSRSRQGATPTQMRKLSGDDSLEEANEVCSADSFRSSDVVGDAAVILAAKVSGTVLALISDILTIGFASNGTVTEDLLQISTSYCGLLASGQADGMLATIWRQGQCRALAPYVYKVLYQWAVTCARSNYCSIDFADSDGVSSSASPFEHMLAKVVGSLSGSEDEDEDEDQVEQQQLDLSPCIAACLAEQSKAGDQQLRAFAALLLKSLVHTVSISTDDDDVSSLPLEADELPGRSAKILAEPLLVPFFKSADATSVLVNALCEMVKRASAAGVGAAAPLMLLSVTLEQVPVVAPKRIRATVIAAIQKQLKTLMSAVQQQKEQQQPVGLDDEEAAAASSSGPAAAAFAAVEQISTRLAAVQVQ